MLIYPHICSLKIVSVYGKFERLWAMDYICIIIKNLVFGMEFSN